MYRLLKIKNLHLFSSQVFSSNQQNILTCSFCKHNFFPAQKCFEIPSCSRIITRSQTTNVHSAVPKNNASKKKKARRKKKYAELLEIADGSSSHTKAPVSKLNATHLSLLAEQPDINLSQLHHLKKLKATSPKQKNIDKQVNPSSSSSSSKLLDSVVADTIRELASTENFRHLVSSGSANENILDEINELNIKDHLSCNLKESENENKELLSDELLEMPEDHKDTLSEEVEPIQSSSTSDDKGKKKKKGKKTSFTVPQKYRQEVMKVKKSEREHCAAEETLTRIVCSYLDVCVNRGMMKRAIATLQFYRDRNRHAKDAVWPLNVKLYEIVLCGLAGKCQLAKLQEIMSFLDVDKVKPSPQCYAACFECVGRMQSTYKENMEFLEACANRMKREGLSFNDLVTKCTFISDQREKTMDAIRLLEPNFEPFVVPPDMCYSCSLLQHLNRKNDSEQSFGYHCPGRGVLSQEDMKAAIDKQFEMEVNGYLRVASIEKDNKPDWSVQHYRTVLKELEDSWRPIITQALKRDLLSLKSVNQRSRLIHNVNLYPYLCSLDLEQYTEIIIQEIRKLAEGSETYSPSMNTIYRTLGALIQSRYQVQYKTKVNLVDKTRVLFSEYCKWYLDPPFDDNISNCREKWQHLVHENQKGPTMDAQIVSWPNSVLVGLGKFLYNIILRDIKIDVNAANANPTAKKRFLPAFYTIFRHRGKMVKEELKPHPALVRLYGCAMQKELVFDVNVAPMFVPPLPWSSITFGGYILAKADLIRLPYQAVQQLERLRQIPVHQMYPSFDSLNQLGAVPWTVNEPVLDVVIEVFNSGGSQKLDIPQPQSACPVADPVTPEMSKEERYKAFRQRLALRRCKAEMYSLWCDALYRLSLANHFRKTIFWLPHNMDFRGRVYPLPPHLSHIGADMARSILRFAKGKPLGSRGLDWLKIHVINLTGLKKKDSISDRLKYANEMLPEIIDSARNPLTGSMWWSDSEEPWQTLAACMEINNAINSGDPENYICYFPVHQDGSCNGLQHYAALGRDQAGGESVNLVPAEKPQDVYGCVAVLVEKERQKDADSGLRIAQVLEGFVRRKVIKQTVMTTVYGVTRYGARQQIAKQLKDLDDFPKEHVWQASTYLTTKTLFSLREMFTSTKQIQDWFTECARYISYVCGENMEWVTPLGLPVVQPYTRPFKIGNSSSKLSNDPLSMDMFELPNIMKQRNAFPPNFIHSLDSSHMMLTSLHCEREGLTFVSVHDCYWTHPCTVAAMNKICREQFVALHSQPILEDLSKFLQNKYGYRLSESHAGGDDSGVDAVKSFVNRTLRNVPSKGTLDINTVLDSVYFFS